MAGSASPIQELRTSLEKSRWELHDGLLRLEDRLRQEEVRTPPAPAGHSLRLIRHLPQDQVARIISVALVAGLAIGFSWSRRIR